MIDARHTLTVGLLPPVPLINLKGVASGTWESHCHSLPQINTSRSPHTDRLTRAWSVTTTFKNVEISLKTNLRQSESEGIHRDITEYI